jgi:hypothetical protein
MQTIVTTVVIVLTGRSLTGKDYRQQGHAWVYGNEEDTIEMHRRFGGLCLLHGVDPSTLRENLRLSSGYGRSLVIARRIESTGDVVPTGKSQMPTCPCSNQSGSDQLAGLLMSKVYYFVIK